MKKAKSIAVAVSALMLITSTVSTISQTPIFDTMTSITAHAELSSAYIQGNLFNYSGAKSGTVYDDGMIVRKFTADELNKGFSVNVSSGATVVLQFDDGTVTYNAFTHEILEYNRANKVYEYTINLNQYNVPSLNSDFDIFSNYGYADPSSTSYLTYGAFINVYSDDLRDGISVRVKYKAGYDYFMHYATGEIYKYNADRNTWEFVSNPGKTGSDTEFIKLEINEDVFPLAAGCTSGTLWKDDEVVLQFTGEEFASGSLAVRFQEYKYECYNIEFSFNSTNDNGAARYDFMGRVPYLTKYNRSGGLATTIGGSPVISENGVLDNAGDSPLNSNGNIHLYKDSAEILSYSPDEFKGTTENVIPDYDANSDYFLKIDLDDEGTNAIYYKWNPDTEEWEYRVNTKETPKYIVPISVDEFPDENAGGAVYTGENAYPKFTQEELNNGTQTFAVDTTNPSNTTVQFDYDEKDNDDATTGVATYTFVGIDPVLVSRTGENNVSDRATPNVQADPGDKLVIDGTLEDGTEVHREVVVPDNGDYKNDKGDIIEGNPNIVVSDGEYTITNETKGIIADVVVDTDNSRDTSKDKDTATLITGDDPQGNGEAINLDTPVEGHTYTIYTPDGAVVDEGAVSDGTLDSLDDIHASGTDLGDFVYYVYEEHTGTTNTTGNGIKVETGYLVINEDGTVKKLQLGQKGDVDLDGDVDVQDIVYLQKYLLKRESFKSISNFIQADMNGDGKVNVFDLALQKRYVINNR